MQNMNLTGKPLRVSPFTMKGEEPLNQREIWLSPLDFGAMQEKHGLRVGSIVTLAFKAEKGWRQRTFRLAQEVQRVDCHCGNCPPLPTLLFVRR
jgi:hypothetical protein